MRAGGQFHPQFVVGGTPQHGDGGLAPYFKCAAVDGRMVSAACLQPAHNGVTEIAGIATLRPFRRQGIGTLLTAAAVQAAFAQGIDIVFLTAGSAEAGRVYERAGFRTIGSGLIYGWPTIKAQA